MFGVGWAELLVILAVALVVVGPEKLPEVARGLGRLYGQLYRTLTEARESLRAEADLSRLDPPPDPPAPERRDKPGPEAGPPDP